MTKLATILSLAKLAIRVVVIFDNNVLHPLVVRWKKEAEDEVQKSRTGGPGIVSSPV